MFGIYKFGIRPRNNYTYKHETSWGFAGGSRSGNGTIICNGEWGNDKSSSYLYSSQENQIDMLCDFDNGVLSYSVVDDQKQERKYTFTKRFNTNINYTVYLHFSIAETEVQIAKIDVDMFGKNKNLVKWSKEKY